MKTTLFFIISFFALFVCKAQKNIESQPIRVMDSLKTSGMENAHNNIGKSWISPSLFFMASAATWSEREKIREIRNRYIPTFRVRYDDYLQYAPTVAVFGLKSAGVKGRNNIGRAALSYATGLVIMGVLVNSIKYSAKIERPDGSSKNSFPSGHTAMAFTNATFLHKEYGLFHFGYSIAGYSAAAFTGLGRNLNNRHWISDVLAGAGIGIAAAELGYFFVNRIYGNDGDNIGLLSRIEGNEHPSFLSIKLGTALATKNFLKESELDDQKEVGFEAGLEGAYFFSKNWGVGGDFNFTSFPVKPLHLPLDDPTLNFDIVTQSLGLLNVSIGPYYSFDFSEKFQLLLKATGGYSFPAKGRIFIKSESINLPSNEFEIAGYSPSNSLKWNSGAAITYKITPRLGITSYADYNHTTSTLTYHFSQLLQDDEEMNSEFNNEKIKEKISYFTLGLKLTAYF